MQSHPLYGVLIAFAGALVLTPDTLFMRLSELDASAMLAWRGFLMGTTLIGFWLLMVGRKAMGELRSLATKAGVVVIFCHVMNAVLFNAGVAVAPVALVLLGVATVPVFSAITAYLIGGERITLATTITIVFVMVGIAVAVIGHDQQGITLDARAVFGAIAGLSVALAFAISFAVLRNTPSLAVLPTMGLGAFLAGSAGLVWGGSAAMLDGEVWAIAVSGALILPLSFGLLMMATRHTHPSNVSLFLLLEAVLGPLWVWWGVGEELTTPTIVGGLIVVISLAGYLVHLRRIAPA